MCSARPPDSVPTSRDRPLPAQPDRVRTAQVGVSRRLPNHAGASCGETPGNRARGFALLFSRRQLYGALCVARFRHRLYRDHRAGPIHAPAGTAGGAEGSHGPGMGSHLDATRSGTDVARPAGTDARASERRPIRFTPGIMQRGVPLRKRSISTCCGTTTATSSISSAAPPKPSQGAA